jgi:hypothetical protein
MSRESRENILHVRTGSTMRRVLTGLVVAFSVACLDEGVTGGSTITGAYTLRSINGSPLPFTISESGTARTEILSDVITLYQGGTYARSRDSRITVNAQVTIESRIETGAYSLFGTSVSMRNVVGTTTVATIGGNTMTIVEPGMTAVFTK